MASRRPRVPVGGGDSIVIWQSAAVLVTVYVVLIAIFVLAIVSSAQGQSASRLITAIAFFGVFIAGFVFGIVLALRRRPRLQVCTETIMYVSRKDDTLTLFRQSGNVLRTVRSGTPSRWRIGLTNGDGATSLPISDFSDRKVRRACAARSWEYPAATPARRSGSAV